jgi:hypothetical protein
MKRTSFVSNQASGFFGCVRARKAQCAANFNSNISTAPRAQVLPLRSPCTIASTSGAGTARSLASTMPFMWSSRKQGKRAASPTAAVFGSQGTCYRLFACGVARSIKRDHMNVSGDARALACERSDRIRTRQAPVLVRGVRDRGKKIGSAGKSRRRTGSLARLSLFLSFASCRQGFAFRGDLSLWCDRDLRPMLRSPQ